MVEKQASSWLRRIRWRLKFKLMTNRKFGAWFFDLYMTVMERRAEAQGAGDIEAGWERLRRDLEKEGPL